MMAKDAITLDMVKAALKRIEATDVPLVPDVVVLSEREATAVYAHLLETEKLLRQAAKFMDVAMEAGMLSVTVREWRKRVEEVIR